MQAVVNYGVFLLPTRVLATRREAIMQHSLAPVSSSKECYLYGECTLTCGYLLRHRPRFRAGFYTSVPNKDSRGLLFGSYRPQIFLTQLQIPLKEWLSGGYIYRTSTLLEVTASKPRIPPRFQAEL